MNTLRLVLAVERPLFRAGLRALLESRGGVKVLAETGSGREAVILARNHRPGLVLIETQLAELNGLEAMTQILHFSPRSRMLVVLSSEDGRMKSRALGAGAFGVLSMSASARELDRLLLAARLDRPLPAAAAGPSGRAPSRPGILTPRQFQVLKLLSEGSGVKRIARQLGISAKTVETHRAQVMERLHIYDLVGLVRYALREKITRL